MTSPQAAKGSKWERDVVGFLRGLGLRVYRPRQEGFEDVGDVHVGPAVLQAKDWRDWQSAIREGLDGAVAQARAWDAKHGNASRSYPAAVVKRARRGVADAYVVMRLEDFVRLLER